MPQRKSTKQSKTLLWWRLQNILLPECSNELERTKQNNKSNPLVAEYDIQFLNTY